LSYGDLQTEDDVLLITCCEGIKASVVADGRILSGLHGNFGSVGHFIVVENGRPCHCGSKGCLEMYASGYAFREAIKSRMGQTTHTRNLLPSSQPEEVFRLAAEGDVFCREIVEEAIPYMSYAFASLVRLTDIDEVILLGTYAEGGDYLRNLLHENIARQLPEVARENLKIQMGSRQDTETIVAAAALPVIQGHFELQIL
jgi:glucokinase